MSNSPPLHPSEQRNRSNFAVGSMVAAIGVLAVVLIAGVALWAQYRVESLPMSEGEKTLLINAAEIIDQIDPQRERDLLVRVDQEHYTKRKYPDGMVELTYQYQGQDPALQLEMEHNLQIYQTVESAEAAFFTACEEVGMDDTNPTTNRYESATNNDRDQRTVVLIAHHFERIAILKLSIASGEFVFLSPAKMVEPLNEAFFRDSAYDE